MKMKILGSITVLIILSFTGCDEHKERKTIYPNGNTKSIVHYLDGKKDGEEIQYTKKGKLRKKIMWSMGEKIGMIEYWHDINGDQEIRYGYYDKDKK